MNSKAAHAHVHASTPRSLAILTEIGLGAFLWIPALAGHGAAAPPPPMREVAPAAAPVSRLTGDAFARDTELALLKELRLGTIAAQRARHPIIQRFATFLQVEHSQLSFQLRTLARSKGYSLPPTNLFSPAHPPPALTRDGARGPDGSAAQAAGKAQTNGPTATNDRLEVRGAPEATHAPPEEMEAILRIEREAADGFDRAYVAEVVQDHEKLILEFDQVIRDLRDPATRSFAVRYLPTLRRHYSDAQGLAATLGSTIVNTRDRELAVPATPNRKK